MAGNRNYRRIKDQNGNIVANIITVDGMDVPVTEEVYAAYARWTAGNGISARTSPRAGSSRWSRWRRMASSRTMWARKQSPVLKITSSHGSRDGSGKNCPALLPAALISLEDRDRQLITALFFDHISTRECARRMGVTQRAVIKRRDRILRDMKKYFVKFSA